MPEQLDLFSTSTTEQESNPVHKASAMLLERRLKPPAVIMQNQGPEIVAPRTKENNVQPVVEQPYEQSSPEETIAFKPEPIQEPAKDYIAESLQDTEKEFEPEPHQDNASEFINESVQDNVIELIAEPLQETNNELTAELTEDINIGPTPEMKDLSTGSTEIEEVLTENASFIPTNILPIVEPIAIIAVKPIEEDKPKTARGRKSIKEMSMEADLPEIPEDEKLFSKQYYGIGEVAIMFHVNASLLRYWETEFDILKPKKNGKGDRFFRPDDIKNLQIIHHLLRQKKFTIQGAKDYLKSNKQSKEKFEMVRQLQQLKTFLLEMKAGL